MKIKLNCPILPLSINKLKIPVFILIRPREGDFNYSNEEFELMKADIVKFKEMGCKGIVSGVLNNDNTIDLERTKELMQLSRPLEFTFHRAFDEGNNLEQNLEDVIATGCDTLLTAGQENNVDLGFDNLERLIKISNGIK